MVVHCWLMREYTVSVGQGSFWTVAGANNSPGCHMSSTDTQRRLNLAYIWDLGFLPLGGSMVAVSVKFFLAPARIPDGTMLPLGMVAQYLFGRWAECFAVLRRIRRPRPHHTGQVRLN